MIALTANSQKACNVAKGNGATGCTGKVGAENLPELEVEKDHLYVMMVNRFSPNIHVDISIILNTSSKALIKEEPIILRVPQKAANTFEDYLLIHSQNQLKVYNTIGQLLLTEENVGQDYFELLANLDPNQIVILRLSDHEQKSIMTKKLMLLE
ncbi:MAG: hypothetical protein ACJAZ3_000217 [Sphingobacteriales bacterium]